MLLVPCPVCGVDQLVPIEVDGDDFRAPELLPVMNHHVITAHEMGVSGM